MIEKINLDNNKEKIVVEPYKEGEMTPNEIRDKIKEIEKLLEKGDQESIEEAGKKLALIEQQMNQEQERIKEENEKRKNEEKEADEKFDDLKEAV